MGGGFENFNWLAAFVVQIPLFTTVYKFNRRAIGPIKFVIQIPIFVAI